MTEAPPIERTRLTLRGAVQGVGFRPFVYRLATKLGLSGWVRNSGAGLIAEVEGEPGNIGRFLDSLEDDRPAQAVILEREVSYLPPTGLSSFEILPSDDSSEKSAVVMPDLATCSACLREIFDTANARFAYPFTNCTSCGPRYTIILDIPYDRAHTTMQGFRMCAACQVEFDDPTDRRFHAQPNACPQCGPRLTPQSIDTAATALGSGLIVGLKGIGGFQLLVDASQPEAVTRLRQRKFRDEKPFALMVPSIQIARHYCHISAAEQALLESPAAPIVLLRPKNTPGIAPNVAPHSPFLGIMLPYSPLHHLLMREFSVPVVATSGNRSGEPIAFSNGEAHRRLGDIADCFLTHDRPIARPCDDSVVRVSSSHVCVVRRGRGYAPLPVEVSDELPPVLAVGGHLKNTVAIVIGRQVFLSQHVGDLDTAEARAAFGNAIDDLCRLYRFTPKLVACDLHPDYASSAWADASGLPVVAVQHHHAHLAACAAENDVRGPYLGIAWDGTGYGLDGTAWGGEFFLVRETGFERIAHLRPFHLPGGEAAAREGWRSAASLLWETFGPERFPASLLPSLKQRSVLWRMIERGVNAPLTTSVGRLFDAVAALAGVAYRSHFEGQAAMSLEREIGSLAIEEAYPLPQGDWGPLVVAVVEDVLCGIPRATIAAKFHNALAEWMLSVAGNVGVRQIVLSGGVFQNSTLVERATALLRRCGFAIFTHRQVPCNDGGIALGQAILAGRHALRRI